ncbi:glycosyltransferase family 2 protein [Nioella sp.]|uniref:glycosyltransferase family 2 protein n=1 Tax=Nioella sp. TaxID=1912091 RepID=UPI0035599FCE
MAKRTDRSLTRSLRSVSSLISQGLSQRSGAKEQFGYVERITSDRIEGWVKLPDEVTDFTITVGSEHRSLKANRFPRDDVRAAVPDAPENPGFSLDVPADFYADIKRFGGVKALSVLAAGQRLEPTAELLEAIEASLKTVMGTQVDAGSVQNGIAPAVSSGSVVTLDRPLRSEGTAQHGLKLRIDASQTVSRVEAQLSTGSEMASLIVVKDAAESTDDRFVGFADLPGIVWNTTSSKRQLKLQLVTPEGAERQTVQLGKDDACGAIELMALNDWKNQSEVLLAIEHAKYLGKSVTFSTAARRWLAQKAELYGCGDFLASSLATDGLDISPSTAGNARYHKAFSDVLTQLDDSSVTADKVILNSARRFGLTDKEELALSFAYVAEICRRGRFEEYVNAISTAELRRVSKSTNRWESTNALPFLAARGELVAASEILELLAKQSGWINTECIYIASRYFQELPGPAADKARFVYTLVGLLDALSKDYWSRIHDRYLIRAFAIWFEDAKTYPRWLLNDLENTALRVYGLSPDFWDAMSDRSLTPPLAQGRQNFAIVRRLGQGKPDEQQFMETWQAICFFRDLGCSDAKIALREAHASALQWFAGNDQMLSRLAGMIAPRDMDTLLRTSAHPFAPDPAGEAEMGRIYEALRVIGNSDPYGERSSSQLGAAMKAAGQAISGLSGPTEDVALFTRRLEKLCQQLNVSEAAWIAADVLSRGAELLHRDGQDCTYLARLAEGRLLEAVRSDAKSLEAPTVTSALNRLATLPGSRYWSDGRPIWAHGPSRAALAELRQAAGPLAETAFNTLERALLPPNDGMSGDAPGFDTLVVLYSCRKYLKDRIPVLRDTWIKELKARGIPYLVLVGDGDDTVDGDVLALNVKDTYEALPDKTLAMIRWVYENTGYQFLYKIDDDCHLSVSEFFDTMTYRKFHYYGRSIYRPEGAMQRDWHQEKSAQHLARAMLDRSPEPSRYCDGGAGYSLSRHAMQMVCEEAETDHGLFLRSVSFMEDKLVGDLLARRGMTPANEDYLVHVYRKTHPESSLVTKFDNGFETSPSTPTRVVHLDGAIGLAEANVAAQSASLRPRKIWPSCAPAQIGWNTHQLELLSGPDQLARVADASHVLVAVLRSEMTMLPHFLSHYRALGIEAFIIADNLSTDGSREYLLSQEDVLLYSVDSEYKASHFGVAWQQAMLANHCVGKWVILADADEFFVFPDWQKHGLASLTQKLDAEGFDCVGTWLIDMYPKGDLGKCDFKKTSPFDLARWHDDPPVQLTSGGGFYSNTKGGVTSTLRHRLSPEMDPTLFVANKYPLIKYAPWIRLSEGIHYVGNVSISPTYQTLCHFKYHAEFAEKIQREIRRKQHYGEAVEYQRYQQMLGEARGRFFDPAISVEFDASRSYDFGLQAHPLNEGTPK